jgi:hypothetical protein
MAKYGNWKQTLSQEGTGTGFLSRQAVLIKGSGLGLVTEKQGWVIRGQGQNFGSAKKS